MTNRLLALDRLRGLLMMVMAIDHVSYFVGNRHSAEFWGLPLPNIGQGPDDTFWFLSRVISHFCAPGFFLLAGASISLFAEARRAAGWSEWQVRRYWIERGLILIIAQQLIENPAWLLGTFDNPSTGIAPGSGGNLMLHFGVLYGLGMAMIVGALLLNLQIWVLTVLATTAVAITALLLPDSAAVGLPISTLLMLAVVPGHSGAVQVLYPAAPWIAVTILGMLLGRGLRADAGLTFRLVPVIGIALLVLFVAVRSLGGDAGQLLNIVAPQGDGALVILSVVKYPPAVAYLLMTLGGNLLLLAAFARFGSSKPSGNGPLLVFGQSALFFYMLHLYVYAVIGLLLPGPQGLSVTYASWVFGLGLLYPVCRKYRHFKASTAPESWWRLF